MTGDDNTIDYSEWLPRDASVVKPERVAKGDIDCIVRDGRIAAAQVTDRSLLAALVERGILEEHHHYYAMTFLDLRRYFRREVEYKGNALYAREFLSISNSGILETLYLRVCRNLGRAHERVVIACIEQTATELGIRAMVIGKNDCRTSFDALVRSVDEARKDLEGES